MELNNSKDDAVNDSTNSKDSEEDESFVTKVRSRVSGLFSSSFSRLFKNQRSGVIRPRSNEDEESTEHQPPSKRAKGIENETLAAKNFRGNAISHSQFMASLNNESGLESTGEPIAGPSYISQRNIQKIVPSASTPLGVSNKEKYGDSEYTSGYSSMEKFVEKQTILGGKSISESASEPIVNSFSERKSLFNSSTLATPSRSLFANQSVSPQDKNTSLSSRKPSFSPSNFGSPSFVDRTLTTSKIINSPFYNGSTIYGGASAYGRQLGINETRKQQLKNSFLVKPINKSSDTKSFTSLSKTARRILETLEQCSTPMTDVKKVPLPTRTEKQGVFSRYVAANPYQKTSNVSKRELLVPSVSERLKMKQIQRLQDTTNEIRQIANSSNSNLNSEGYKVATNNQQKHNNKMKTKITSVRNKAPMIEVLDNYILNPVPLMIPENKYPTFELPELNIPKEDKIEESPIVGTAKPSLTKTSLVEGKGDSNTDKEKLHTEENQVVTLRSNTTEQKISINEKGGKEIHPTNEYTFSKPLVIAENSKSLIAINNFKFSEPLSKKIKLNDKDSETIQKKVQINKTTTMTNGNISSDVDLKKSSDPLLEKFKAPEGTWECQTCLIRNKSEATKCAACETPRVEKSQSIKKDSSSSFGVQFSKKLDEWDCSTCLVRNKVQNNVCVACSTPKVSKPETNGVGNKYKSPCKEWECGTCWVRNKSDSLKCVACESIRNVSASKLNDALKSIPKQKCQKCFNEIGNDGKCTKCDKNNINQLNFNIPSHLKPSTDTWECGTCLIRNKNDLKKCAACETPREKLNNDIKAVSFSKKSDKWECPTCMVQNNSDVEKCPCCETIKPGVTLISKSNVNMFNFGVNKTQFSFGIPKDMQSSALPVNTSSLFANNTVGSSSTNLGFKFGVVSESKENKTEQLTSTASVSKSENKPESSSSKSKPTSDKTEKSDTFQFKAPSAVSDQKTLPMFKFGAPAPDLKEPPKDAAASNVLFKFTPPKSIAVENNPTIPPSEGVKKTEGEKNSFAVPPVSQGDSSNKTFSFGSKDNDSKDQTAKPMFSFGSSSSSTQPGGFNFNTVKSDLVQQPTNSTGFASTTIQPLQSTNSGGTALKNGGFNFGSSTNSSQAAVFSFGATQNPAQTMPLAKGGFDFSTAAKPTGGFSFTSPTPSTADAGSKPTFNFTGGSIPTFSANPTEGGGGPVPVRKFKRAVRRTQR